MRAVLSAFSRLLHRQYWLSALLLGCLVLRAFLPAGYMLDSSSGALSLKMCSGLTLSTPTDSGDETATPHGICPAGAPLLALAFALTLTPDTPVAGKPIPSVLETVASSIPPSPSRLARGPPATLA